MGRINLNADAADMADVLKELELIENVPRTAEKALTAGANIILRRAKETAPVRSGELKKALKVGRRAKNRDRFAVEVGVFHGDVGYAHLVEGGHGGDNSADPHPFLAPAAEDVADEVTQAIMEELMKGL